MGLRSSAGWGAFEGVFQPVLFVFDDLPVEAGLKDTFGELRKPAVLGDLHEVCGGFRAGQLNFERVCTAFALGGDGEEVVEAAHGVGPLGSGFGNHFFSFG